MIKLLYTILIFSTLLNAALPPRVQDRIDQEQMAKNRILALPYNSEKPDAVSAYISPVITPLATNCPHNAYMKDVVPQIETGIGCYPAFARFYCKKPLTKQTIKSYLTI